MRKRPEKNGFDLAVVGAGAAGQMAAIAAAEEDKRVVLLEQMPQAGMKLLVSGGGRANLTNMLERTALEAAFGRQGRFTGAALEIMGPTELRKFLARLGIETVVDEQSRVYPASQRAVQVQAALVHRIEHLRVRLRLGCTVSRLWLAEGRLMGVETSAGERIGAERVVLTCGGRSWPKLPRRARVDCLAETQQGRNLRRRIVDT